MAAPVPVRYEANPFWPNITWGHDARCTCTWAWYQGTWQVKVLHAICVTHCGYRSVSRG